MLGIVLGCRRYLLSSWSPALAHGCGWAAPGGSGEPGSTETGAAGTLGAKARIILGHGSQMSYRALGCWLTCFLTPLGCPLIRQHGQKSNPRVCS